MSTVSREQLADAMRRSGFPAWAIPVGVAVATAESSRITDRQSNSTYPDGSREQSFGVWQIHLPAHPDVSHECATDLQCSTDAAFRISGGGHSWNAWSAFTNGSYRPFLDPSADPTPTPGEPNKNGTPPTTGSKPTRAKPDGGVLGSGFGTITGTLTDPTQWHRAAFLIAGLVLVTLGARAYMSPTPSASAIDSTPGPVRAAEKEL